MDQLKTIELLKDLIKKIRKGDVIVQSVQRTVNDTNGPPGEDGPFQYRNLDIAYNEKSIPNQNEQPTEEKK